METKIREKRGLDYYGILGLTKSANDLEIKNAYRSLSIKYNPIRNKCSDAKMFTLFSLVGEAYEVLSKPMLKCIYDQYGEAGLKGGVLTIHGFFPPWQYTGGPYQTYKSFFNMPNPYANIVHCMQEALEYLRPKLTIDRNRKQAPIEQYLELTLEEVYTGAMKKIKIKRRRFDKEQIMSYDEEKILCVNIRPGTPSGTKIVYKAVGDEGPTVIPGDLIVTTRDIPHPRFRREGVDLHIDINLQIHRALADLTVEVTTLDCRVIRLAITDFVTPGYQKIIPNEGLPYVDDNDKKGNLILTFSVTFPKYLTEKAKKKVIDALLSASRASTDFKLVDPPDALARVYLGKTTPVLKEPQFQIGEEPCEEIDYNKENILKI